MTNFKKYFLGVITLIFLSPNLLGQNIDDALRVAEPGLGIGARALGMGDAYLGLSDDASGIYFNPAGLGLIKRMEFSGGLSYNGFSNNSTLLVNSNPAGSSTNYTNSATQLNQLAFVFPIPTSVGSLVFGMAYNKVNDYTGAIKFDGYNGGNTSKIQSLYNSNINLNIPYWLFLTDTSGFLSPQLKGQLNQSGTVIASGSINNWAFSGAVEVGKNLFIGGTLNLISGEYKNSNDYYEDDYKGKYHDVQLSPGDSTTLGFQTFNLNQNLTWDITGWDFKLGLLYQVNKIVRLGATIQFPKNYTIKETYSIDGYSIFDNVLGHYVTYIPDNIKNNFSYSDFQYDITTPYSFDFGASFNFLGLIASGEVTLTDYTQTQFTNTGEDSYLNTQIKDNFRATANTNLGLEYTIPMVGLRVRGGFIYQPSPYKGDPGSFAKKYVTGGLGYLFEGNTSVDLAIAHGWYNTFVYNYGTEDSRVNQSITTNTLLLSFSYRF